MPGPLAFVLLSGAALTMYLFVVLLPSRVLQPIARDKVLRLLDDIDWAIRDGELPADDPGVDFMRHACYVAGVKRQPGAVELMYLVRHPQPDRENSEWPSSTAHLNPDQRRIYHELERRLRVVLPAFVVSGSWIGLIWVAVNLGLALRVRNDVHRRRHGAVDPGPGPVPDRYVTSAADVVTGPSLRAAA